MFNEREFRIALARVGLTMKDIAKSLEISPTTLYRKVAGESDFYRHEIQIVCELVGKEYLDVIFFNSEVA